MSSTDSELREERKQYFSDKNLAMLLEGDARDIGYCIPMLVAKLSPLPSTREQHEKYTDDINALVIALEKYIDQKVAEAEQRGLVLIEKPDHAELRTKRELMSKNQSNSLTVVFASGDALATLKELKGKE